MKKTSLTELNIEAIEERHLRKEQMEHRTFYEGHIVIDLSACVDEIRRLREMLKDGPLDEV
jgi:hypothetical protein